MGNRSLSKREAGRRNYYKRKEQGVCVACGRKLDGDWVHCKICRDRKARR